MKSRRRGILAGAAAVGLLAVGAALATVRNRDGLSIVNSLSLSHLLIPLFGCALFLRIVAKEKRRREKYLLMRLEELHKAEEEKAALEAEAREQAENAEAEAEEVAAVAAPVEEAA